MISIATRIANRNKKLRKDRRKAIITAYTRRVTKVLGGVNIGIPYTIAILITALLLSATCGG